ncbi:MAG: methyl-accepting chemotaxis protein [Deltaproteobacteria bacterium]
MITLQTIESFKEMAPFMADLVPGGVVYAVSDLEQVTWKLHSASYDLTALHVGTEVRVGGALHQAMARRQVSIEKVPRNVYGTRLLLTAFPILDGDKVVGSFAVYQPRLHPVAGSFNAFAPIMGEMFSEGSVIYISDMEKFAYVYDSKKFSLPGAIAVGVPLNDGSAAKECIKNARPVAHDLPASLYGVPVMVMAYPLFDEDDDSLVIGCFGIVLPRETAVKLRDMSGNLKEGLAEISSAIEELAASASQISDTERLLNDNVLEIGKLSEDINDILAFIKQIADETKMLGLNAAIEAARAGEAGRGFGVVAEEIRKLSDESKETVVRIRALTDNIKYKIVDTTSGSEATLRAAEEQAAASEEITASVQEITSLADQLDFIAREM